MGDIAEDLKLHKPLTSLLLTYGLRRRAGAERNPAGSDSLHGDGFILRSDNGIGR